MALAGGVGGAKMLVGLQRALGLETAANGAGRRADPSLTAAVNVGDDATIYGLHVSPDVDICTYWACGLADEAQGWGVAGDTFSTMDALAALGVDTWFRLGDRDLATCLYRTRRLAEGASLSQVTAEIAGALGAPARLLPASDDRIATMITTTDGRRLEFQEYFVRERTRPEVAGVAYEGLDEARPGPGVLESIQTADVVVICPSNPVLSIAPLLLADIRGALASHPSVVAVTPIVRGAALKGPADRILASLGMGASASAVAGLYADLCDVFVVDASDEGEAGRVEALGLEVAVLDTVMTDRAASERLAKEILAL